ncbi:P-loop NTPase fold protein [Maridesulfovibrio ferrireducens]|uniref:P-loop NTPase fold protein n=1 Tax=Maridesulfovibrio ferrireducens TaxID=246191 RepID=UPI001A224B38|nr:P-loop NTPase fold protein [Maridesulfovibrio ferrireducens]MBI9111817.1 hypothetical protein [Maridesulfovibrio ferrireducens]
MLNQHITDYLQYYVNSKKSPDHAVMLNGPWGSGKTWFIKEFVKSQGKAIQFLHVSLYGFKSVEEIDNEVFRLAHPKLFSKGMIASKVAANALLRGGLSLGLNEFSELFPKKETNPEKYVLIFDDIERCHIDAMSLFGHINYLIENGHKAVLICYEEELAGRWDADGDKRSKRCYSEIKEKLVGKSFIVEPDATAAINSFIEEIEHEKSKEICRDNIETIEIIFIESGYNNLRHIKRGLWDYSLFVSSLSGNATIVGNKDFLSHILKLFLIYTIEARKGELSSTGLITDYILEATQKENNTDEAKLNLSKYSCVDARSILLSHKVWTCLLFCEGNVSKFEIEQSILNSPYFYDESTPEWKKLWNYYYLEDDKFRELKNIILNQFKTCDFERFQILLHVFGILLRLRKQSLIDMDKQELFEQAKKNVDILLERGLLYTEEVLSNEYATLRIDTGWDGLGYSCSENPLFRSLQNYIKDQLLVDKKSFLEEESKDLLVLMSKDPDEFGRQIIHNNSGDSLFYDKAVLKYISPAKFAKSFAELSNAGKRTVKSALSLRYEPLHASALVEEAEWLEKLRIEIEKESKKWEKELSSIYFTMMLEYIDGSLINLKAAKEKAVSSTT